MRESWTVRYARAKVVAREPVASWLHLSVQMLDNEGGCSSCKR